MLIPITQTKGDHVKKIGMAHVEPDGDDFSVEIYMKPGFELRDDARADVVKGVKLFARGRTTKLKADN